MRIIHSRLRRATPALGAALLTVLAFASAHAAVPVSGNIRFLDSATGCAIPPEDIQVERAGEAWSVRGVNHSSLSGISVSPVPGFKVNVELDPILPPRELQKEYLDQLRRPDATVFVGFISDHETGLPLSAVNVIATPSGAGARSDDRGYFELQVPLPTNGAPAVLTFSKPGYQDEARQYLELWPNGDWIYRIQLEPGEGREIVDERSTRRHSSHGSPMASMPPDEGADIGDGQMGNVADSSPEANAGDGPITADGESAPVVRVPRTIRVLRQDGVTIDYVSLETYTKRVLPSEWIASWANFTGGINSLKAGAVAIRTYAAGFVSNPQTSTYDICGTSSCQVYNAAANNSLANTAVDQTTGYVMVPPGAERITYKLTEYSAENNSLGFPCGNGYTSPAGGCLEDMVCVDENRFGHGRGMCQWGTARWATGLKFSGRSTADTSANGFPEQDWVWICEHYYPQFELVAATPLIIGDYVKVLGTSSLTVRECPGGSIANGVNCPQITTRPSGATGVIVDGPVQVVTDGIGYTWWRVRWFEGGPTEGWSPENWLERTTEPPNTPPVLADIPAQSVDEGSQLLVTNSASAPASIVTVIADFEPFGDGTANGTVMFRQPGFSGSTGSLLDATPDTSSVTGSFPAGNGSSRVLRANWSWTSSANAWLRLTTFNVANLPNPVIDLGRTLSFDIHTDRDLKVAVGVRETGNAIGTPIGTDGGSTGGIEMVGATNASSTPPAPVRVVSAGSWTTLAFDLPNEPVRNFASGNGILSTASGLGTLEHIAFVPAAGSGAYDVHLDNFTLSTPNTLTYSLSNAPPGASIDPGSGVFAWTPDESQGPGVHPITVIVTDSQVPPQSDSTTFLVTVNEVNQAPVLTSLSNVTVHAGALVALTNSATDGDVPGNSLAFSLDPGAPAGAEIDSASGVFTWLTSANDAGTIQAATVRVVDNGTPVLEDSSSFGITVVPAPRFQPVSLEDGNLELTWTAIPGEFYHVQYKTNLAQPTWTDLAPDVRAIGSTASLSNVVEAGERYYRVLPRE